MPSARAIFRMYAEVNGDSRSTSVGETPARSAASTAATTSCLAALWAASVR
jgi:hypothetical protein